MGEGEEKEKGPVTGVKETKKEDLVQIKHSHTVSLGFSTCSTVNFQDGIFYEAINGSYCWLSQCNK